jgi:hypothetical protein
MVTAQCSVIGNVGSHCRDRLYGDDTPVASVVSWVFAFSTQAQQSIVVDPKGPGSINSPHGLILRAFDTSATSWRSGTSLSE